MEPRNKIVKRGRGRPQARPDEETRHLIHEAARRELLESGYAATCMEDVAARAGVSTKTLYRLIPTKAALFEEMVSVAARCPLAAGVKTRLSVQMPPAGNEDPQLSVSENSIELKTKGR